VRPLGRGRMSSSSISSRRSDGETRESEKKREKAVSEKSERRGREEMTKMSRKRGKRAFFSVRVFLR
jgi:hypothetical protein